MSRNIKTKADYQEYQKAVADFFESEGITNLSCHEECEPYFSWHACECCGGTLGGNRHDVSAYHPESKQVLEYSVCEDCVYYAAYGQLDDMTMLGIEDSED